MSYTVKIYVALLIGLVCGVMSLQAATAEEAYKAGDYEVAIRLWEQAKDKDGGNAALFYNLGNAYTKAGDQGGAVLNYEKALRIDPSNKQARENLRYTENLVQIANQTLTDGKNMDPTPADPAFFENVANLVSRFGSNVWAVWAAVFFLLAAGSCAAYLFVPKVTVRKIGFFGGSALLLLSALCVWCAVISKRHALSKDTCVLMGGETTLMLKPDANAKTVGTPLSAGTRLKVMNTARGSDGEDWTEVYLNAEYSGWVPSSAVAVVTVPQLVE